MAARRGDIRRRIAAGTPTRLNSLAGIISVNLQGVLGRKQKLKFMNI